jgi:glycosyltransferase involved in cell wall biosynthesis
MKILFLIHSLGCGGAERALVNILKNLDRNEFSPQLVLLASDTILKKDLPKDIPITKLGIEGSFATLRAVIPLAKIIKNQKPDVVVSFMCGANLIVLLTKFFMRFKAKVVLCEQNHLGEAIQNYRFHWLWKILIKKFYPKADTIIAVSSGVKENLMREFRIPEGKIKVIFNSVDLKNIETLVKAPFQPLFKQYIISVGRLVKQKNYPLLLEAFTKINKEYDIGLIILGEGKERENLEILVHDLGLNGKVLMPGVVDNPFPWLAYGKVFVLCSKYEGFGNVIIEAMACRIPVVATRCPSGPEEIIDDGITGFLVENNNAEKLKEAILKFLENPSLAKKITEKAFKEVKKWDIKKITKKYENLLLEIN